MRTPRSGPAAFRRRSGTRASQRVLVVCEGSTERHYFAALRRQIGLAGMSVITAGGTDPLSLLQEAETQVQAARRAGVPFARAWCVFDRERVENTARYTAAVNEAPKIERALQRRDARFRLHLTCSNACFEVWLLLYFVYSSAPSLTSAETHRRLQTHLPQFKKGGEDVFEQTWDKVDTALAHAGRLRAHQAAVADAPCPDPSTNVDLLVVALRALKQ